jgi:hypothetical protein
MSTRVCDTNIFYNLAYGNLDASKLKAGARIAITPVSILELVSHVTDANLAVRKQAADAALQVVDDVLPDPEEYLATLWQVPHTPDNVPWMDALVALRDAPTVAALSGGIADFQARVVRTVRVPVAHQWRSFHYQDFADKVIDAVDQHVPGYAAARKAGKMKQPKKPEALKIKKEVNSPGALLQVLLATRDRAWLVAGTTPPQAPTQQEIEAAVASLIPYVCVYAKYFEKVATEYAPEPNDWGDLECFIYLQDDREIVTAEDRWNVIAKELGLEPAVRDARVEFRR